MRISLTAEVLCADNARGHCTHVIGDPSTGRLTYLVVKEDLPPYAERLVPFNQVVEASSEQIRLRCTARELRTMDPFVRAQNVGVTVPTTSSPLAAPLSGTYVVPWQMVVLVPEDEELVPRGEVAVRRGAQVETADSGIGRLDELVVEPGSGRITDLVISVPASEIARAEEDVIQLKQPKPDTKGI